MDEDNSQIKDIKANSLDNLSKEELLIKSKTLFALLKKAKVSKDEIVAELEKEKISKAKLMKSFENAQKQSDKELEALNDIVTNLTDNKINIVTKNESLQRQLQLQLSEVESLKNAECILLEDRKIQQLEIARTQTLLQQQSKLIENVTEERNKLNCQCTVLNEEKFHLMDKVQSLEEQVTQTEQLKGKIKLLVKENSNSTKDLGLLSNENNDLRNQVRTLEEEIKAIKIVQDDINLKKKELHENLKIAKAKIESLSEKLEDQSKEDSMKELDDKLSISEISLQKCRQELEQVKIEKFNLGETYQKLMEKVNSYEPRSAVVLSSDKESDSPTFQSLDCNFLLTSHENKFKDLSSDNLLKSQQIENLLCQIQILEQELQQLKPLETQNCETNAEYELLKQRTIDLIYLVNQLFCLEEGDITLNIFNSLKSTCSQLEIIKNSFGSANLETFCVKFSSDIKQLSKELSVIFDATEKLESECLVVDPVITIFSNLADFFLMFNKVYKFNLSSDLISNIDFGKSQVKKFGNFLANMISDNVTNLNEINRLHCQIEEGKQIHLELSEKLEELQKNFVYYEKAYNEEHKLKLLLEDSSKNINDINMELNSKLKMLEQEYVIPMENCAKSIEEMTSLIDSSNADNLHKDKIIREKDCIIFDLKENLSKNAECYIHEINHKINILKSNYEEKIQEIQSYLCSKQNEIGFLEKRYLEMLEEMNLTQSNYKNVKLEISEIKICIESLTKGNIETQKLLETELDLVKNDKLKLEAEFLNLTKQYQEKITEEASLLKINDDCNNLKKYILTLESSLDETKKELESTSLLNKTLADDCGRFKNSSEIASSKVSALEGELEDTLKLKSEIEDNITYFKNENLNLKYKCESFERQVLEFQESSKLLSEKISSLSSDADSLRAENKMKSNDMIQLKEELQSTAHQRNELSNNIADKEFKLLELEKLYEISIKQYESCQGKCKTLNENIEIYNDKLENCEKELDRISVAYAKSNNEYEALLAKNLKLANKEVEDARNFQEITKSKEYFEEQVGQLDIKLTKLMEENASLNHRISISEAEVEANSLTRFQEKDGQLKQEAMKEDVDNVSVQDEPSSQCSEILADLNNMNEVLRERGEKISRLEDIIREKNREIDLLTCQLEEVKNKVSCKEEELVSQQEQLKKLQLVSLPPVGVENTIEELEAKISSLEQENEHLKKVVHCSMDNEGSSKIHYTLDNQSEAMSTSTMGKAEDMHRMKELEDTFEERYMKLKSVAIKLKKKLAEQTAEIRVLEESLKKAVNEKDDLIRKSNGTTSKNIQVLQSEVDKLQDNLDVNSKELKLRDKQLFSSAQEISDLKENHVLILEEKDKLSVEIKNLELLLSGQESANISLRNQVFSLETRLNSEEKRRILSEEQEKCVNDKLKAITTELEEAKQESKKHSLIDLELKDYEKIFEELTNQKIEKESKILEVEQLLDNEIKKEKNLNDQIQFLQKQVESEGDRAEKLKKMVSDYKVQLENLHQSSEIQLIEKEKNSETIESLNQELEKLKIAMAELSVESSKSENILRKTKEMAEKQVESLEVKVETLERTNYLLTEELQSLKNDFAGYKIRAQSVLRKKSTVPEDSLEQAKFDREQLNAELEAAHIKTHQLQSELAAVRAEIGFLLSEKDRLSKQTTKLSEELHKNDSEYQGKLECLEKKLESKTKEYQRIIANMSSQSAEMQQNVKLQEETQREAYSQEIKKIQTKLEAAEDKIWQLKNTLTSGVSSGNKVTERVEPEIKESSLSIAQHHIRKHSHGISSSEDHSKIDISNMIREDGEGSEWVEPSRHRSPSHSSYSPPTLEQLINNPFPPQQSFDESASITSATTDFTMREMTKLESKVESCEKRIIQLTTLLSDSEAENAKLVQLSDVLKEEIRRVSRNESREKHLENNEYIKNVVLKFLLLKTGDEKFRLIPVLKTILQLSPEETKQLAIIAKGDEGSGAGSQAWATYLHLWSGR